MPDRTYSLQQRFLLAFTLTLALFLGLTGVLLDRAFRDSAEAGVAEQLQVRIYVLLAAFEEADGRFYLSDSIREPRFTQLNSGLYGRVTDGGGEVLRTASALDRSFPPTVVPEDLQRGEFRFGRVNLAGRPHFAMHYAVIWENRDAPFVFSVFESTETFLAEVNRFRASLWSLLGGAALVLLFAQLLLLRWGLAPLRRLAGDIKRIESGDRDSLGSDYPRELGPVTDNFNVLINAERSRQARYRTTLADLAHSLKTPLAVIRAALDEVQQEGRPLAASSREPWRAMEEQVERMDQIVRYQLQRAVRSERGSALLSRRVDVAAVIRRLAGALRKVYAEKAVALDCALEDGLWFRGDERDLMEVMGNVMDNACKYGNGRVQVTARRSEAPGRPLTIVVEDDGAGIPADDRERVLTRGARLDTLPRGQGIGLAVVADIVNGYGGQIDVGATGSGGARIELVFPNVEA